MKDKEIEAELSSPDGIAKKVVRVTEYELWCAIENDLLPFPITVPTIEDVHYLKRLIHQTCSFTGVIPSRLTLIKLKVPKCFEDENEVYISQAELDDSSRLRHQSEISEVWPTQPPDDHVHIYVMLPSPCRGTLRAARKLYDTLWGEHLNVILLDVPDGNGLKYVPKSQVNDLDLRRLGYQEDALLIRNEYIFAFDELETMSTGRGGVVVSGQPGIGKSIFLFYVLFRRLCAMEPTALQMSGHFVVFNHTGVKVHNAAIYEAGTLPLGTWALSDSNASNRQPCDAFITASQQHEAWIVQATSPAKGRWYQWSKELQAEDFVMECFTYEESIALGTILGLDLDRLREQIELWGSSTARTCVMLTRDPRKTNHLIRLATNAAGSLASTTYGFIHQSEKMSNTDSHLLFTLRPKDATRTDTVGDIETKFLRNIVDEAIGQLDATKQIDFYNLTCRHPWFRASAGCVFEKLVYTWLFVHTTWYELPCIAHSPEPPNPLEFIPTCNWVHLSSGTMTLGNADNHRIPFCWLPASHVFPITDAIVCTDTHIITIQSTLSSHNEVNAKQFKKIQNAFPKSFRDARQWCHVLITDDGKHAEALRSQVFKGLPKDVEIYSAVLNIREFCLTAEDLARLEDARNDDYGIDASEADSEEGQATEASGTMTGVSANGLRGQQQMDIDLGEN